MRAALRAMSGLSQALNASPMCRSPEHTRAQRDAKASTGSDLKCQKPTHFGAALSQCCTTLDVAACYLGLRGIRVYVCIYVYIYIYVPNMHPSKWEHDVLSSRWSVCILRPRRPSSIGDLPAFAVLAVKRGYRAPLKGI